MPRKTTKSDNPFVTTDSNPFVNLYLQTTAGKKPAALPIKSKSKKALVHSDTYNAVETPADLVWLPCCKGNPPLWPQVCPGCYQYRTKDMGRVWMHNTVEFQDEDAPKSKVILCQYCGHSSHHHMKGGGVCFDNILSPGNPTEDGHPTVIKTPCDCSCFLAPQERARQEIEDKVIRLMSKLGVQVMPIPFTYNPNFKGSRLSWSHWYVGVMNSEGEVKDFILSSVYHRPPSAAQVLIALYKNSNKVPTKRVIAFNVNRSGAGFESLCAQVQSDLQAVLGENYQTLEEFLR